eukprot:scaffold130567_cov63-Phaeocystis_antarctica.AAC.1
MSLTSHTAASRRWIPGRLATCCSSAAACGPDRASPRGVYRLRSRCERRRKTGSNGVASLQSW